VGEISRNLKLLAKELDIPVIAVCQLNRGPEQRLEKIPQVSDLRESGNLEQDCDLCFLIHRPEMYDNGLTRPGEADVILGKHRNGPTRTFTLASTLHMSSFRELARH
jgi:replicative DNA helicase